LIYNCAHAGLLMIENSAASGAPIKGEITDSLRDLGRRIDHVFHPDRD
jgi:hypothetical protein